jgi:hypothetical protein
METYGGRIGIAPFIVNLVTRWRRITSTTPQYLSPERILYVMKATESRDSSVDIATGYGLDD